MKKSRLVKGLALTVTLCACLWMTGCYIPPDSISGDTQDMSVGSNDLPFQTLAPTATVTGAPAVPTQNTGIDTGIVDTATSAPTINWNDNGGSISPTIAPTTGGGGSGGIAVVTSAPTATPRPTATPSTSLRTGSSGTAVRNLQTRLKLLGYYTGTIDGDYGAGTENAVKAFQKANGLTSDGVAGTKTVEKLYSDNAVATDASSSGGTTGNGGTAQSTPRVTSVPKATATPNLNNLHYLDINVTGTEVRNLQNRLISLGWMAGEADGKYQGATQYAVKAFQKRAGLWNDGIAGPDTQKAIYDSNARTVSTPVSSIGATLKQDMENGSVKAMQSRLIELGFLSGSADGKFGTATLNAVIAFQTANGLNADGQAGTATLNAMYDADAKSANSSSGSGSGGTGDTTNQPTSSTGYTTLREGDSGSAVTSLQTRLKELGYYSGSVDGSYGSGTVTAVKMYQSMNNLTVDGVAGPATQRVLFGTNSSSATYSTLRPYDEGTAVANMQYALYELGYYDGSVDGSYGATTADAVRAFQINNGLSADGVAGNQTLKALYSNTAVSATASTTTYTTLRPGDKGDDVVQLQDALTSLGYMTVSATGVYDDLTTAAVSTFQTYNGLTSDGVAGADTLRKLYSGSAVRYPG